MHLSLANDPVDYNFIKSVILIVTTTITMEGMNHVNEIVFSTARKLSCKKIINYQKYLDSLEMNLHQE